jgi:bacillolysin
LRRFRAIVATLSVVGAVLLTSAQRQVVDAQSRVLTVNPRSALETRAWDDAVNRMVLGGELKARISRPDTVIPGRTIQQLDQYLNGVRVWGGTVSRQLEGVTAVSIFGKLYEGVGVDTTPSITELEAKTVVERIGGAELGPDRSPQLAILPAGDGTMTLVWVGEIFGPTARVRVFIDANTGAVVRRDDLVKRQVPGALVGRGLGVLGDEKKISTYAFGGAFLTYDTLRPPEISTFDMRSNLTRTLQYLNGIVALSMSDYAADTDNNWNDPAIVDAHDYASYTYDYYFKRFGRRGLDNADIPIINLVHLVRRSDVFSASPDDLFTFWLNAGYVGNGVMFYGEGLPGGVFLLSNGKYYDYFSGAIDIVAHELTHGVTEFTSNLDYQNESGALNEAFSDIMGTSVEFFFQPPGTGPMKADYLIGEDISRGVGAGGVNGERSLENPAMFGDPDHYSKRYTGSQDNGGVHINSGIVNHVFYLAIEGGTNRTSGIRVNGVGAANRLQIERVFYRGFAQLMPSNANFSMARSITLQAAADLYGSSSAPFTAVRDAWTAVGVN